MNQPNHICDHLEECRTQVNEGTETSLAALRLYNDPEDLEAAFGPKAYSARESFELLTPEGASENYLIDLWRKAEATMCSDELGALKQMIAIHAQNKSDPVHRAEAIETLLTRSAPEQYRQLLARHEAYHAFQGRVPETNIEALMLHAKLSLANHPYTMGHQINTSDVMMAYLHWGVENIPGFPIKRSQFMDSRDGSILHDNSKTALPEEILDAPRKLTDAEWVLMQAHPEDGAKILSSVAAFSEEETIVRQHHEHWDGSGYPHRLKGEEIHPLARVLALADSFDAMTSHRKYKTHNPSVQEVAAEIRNCAGTQFDPYHAGQFSRFLEVQDFNREKILADNENQWLDISRFDIEVQGRH